MKKLMSLLIMTFLIFGFNGSLLAQDDGIIGPDELALEEFSLGAAAVQVEFQDMAGNKITTIVRGNPVMVHALHDVVQPMKATCILLLPVNDPIYKETALFTRSYTNPAAGEYFPFYIPGWIQIEGTAIAVVIVKDAGLGLAFLKVTPW